MKKIIFLLFLILCNVLSAQHSSNERPRIGLVLSGGGARGIAHVGVLKVLAEAGLEFDYITGTSMGSIVGGLTAVGYSVEELEELLLELDWDEILLDKISRSSISLEEKEDFEKYVGSFPIQNRKITLPVGLVAGQQVQALLTKLCLSAHHIENFDDLPIPFRCIATDVEFGRVVVLKQGFLPDAIRASMSIPSMFAPIEIDGQLLIDGGILHNFPVQECLQMGADIIIGVDVGMPLYSKKELNSLVKILNQAVAFQSVEPTLKARDLCDLLIIPEVNEYSIMDFRKAEELIELGEKAARKMLPQIRSLVDSLNSFPEQKKAIPLTQIENLFIRKVYIQGLRDVSQNLVYGKLQIKEDKWTTTKKIQTAIERVYGSQYFEKVTYKLVPQASGVDLFLRVVEKPQDNLNFSFRYDNSTKTSVLLNATFRNKLVMGSKFSLNLKLGENFGQKVSYFIHTGWKPGFGFGAALESENYEIKIYEKGEKIALYNYEFVSTRFDLQTIVSNSSTLGGAVELVDTDLDAEIVPPDWAYQKIDYCNIAYKAYFILDTYDRIVFPRKGVQIYAELKNTHQISNNIDSEFEPVNSLIFSASMVDRISSRFVYEEKFYLGRKNGDQLPPESSFFLGGVKTPFDITIPFVGYDFMSVTTPTLVLLASNLRYEVFNQIYLSLLVNWAFIGESFSDLIDKRTLLEGYALSLGIDTPLGPIEGTFLLDDKYSDNRFTIALGYEF